MTDAQLAAQKFNDGTIIAASPIREEQGSEPARIVIREFDTKYIVHTQIFAPPHSDRTTTYYIWGTYIDKSIPNALMKAWEFFEWRSRELHFWPKNAITHKPVAV